MDTLKITLKNGETINYRQINKHLINTRPTLLFVHGNMSNHKWWNSVIDLLVQRQKHQHHIIAVDLRGFGQSTYNERCKEIADWSKDLILFCEALGVGKVIANGWSFGGGVCMGLAQIAPELVQKVFLTCSVSHRGIALPNPDKTDAKTQAEILANPRFLFMDTLMKGKQMQQIMQVYETLLLGLCKDISAEEKHTLVESSIKQACYLDLLISLANCQINIEKIGQKAKMVHGAQDLVVKVQTVKETGSHCKYFQIWEDNAHMIPLQSREKYIQSYLSFVQQ